VTIEYHRRDAHHFHLKSAPRHQPQLGALFRERFDVTQPCDHIN